MRKILLALIFLSSFVFANRIKDVELKDLENKYVIYSSIYCGACRKEYKEIQKIYDKYKEKANIAVVLYPSDTNEINYEFIKENKYTFDVYYDKDHKIADYLKVKYVPMIYKYKNNTFIPFEQEQLNEKNFKELVF